MNDANRAPSDIKRLAELVEQATGRAVVSVQRVGGGSICDAAHLRLADEQEVFAKTHPAPPPGFFEVEAAGLIRLAATGTVAVPAVLATTPEVLVLEWVPPGGLTTAGAEDLGRSMAALHRLSCPSFGGTADGYLGPLPLPNSPRPDWPTFYAECRLLPYLRLAVDCGAVERTGAAAVERLCDRLAELAGPPEPPSLLHGDLWTGNVHPGADGRARLIDPAVHGGHRETDLAMLALFGVPHPRVLPAYLDAFPLADGWRDRVALHQLHPLLVHAALFGRYYGDQAVAVARRY